MAIQLKGADTSAYATRVNIGSNTNLTYAVTAESDSATTIYSRNHSNGGNVFEGADDAGTSTSKILADGSAIFTTADHGGVSFSKGGTEPIGGNSEEGFRINTDSIFGYSGAGGPEVQINSEGSASFANQKFTIGTDGSLGVGGDIAVYNPGTFAETFRIYAADGTAAFAGNALTINTSGQIRSQNTYGRTTGSNPRAMQIDSDGDFCGLVSTRASKAQIDYDTDYSWVQELKPASYLYRVKDKETNVYSVDETYPGQQYGLIAEDVEPINPSLCNYGDDGELIGIEYQRLITPILAQLQTACNRIEVLEARINELEAK